MAEPVVWCGKCGKNEVRFSNETRCEDCFADDTEKYHGDSDAVDLTRPSGKEAIAIFKRNREIKKLLGGSNGSVSQQSSCR